jgi:hypothetical protein
MARKRKPSPPARELFAPAVHPDDVPDDALVIGFEIRLGDGDATVEMLLALRKLQREIAEDEPETARRIGQIITEWEMHK